MKWPDSWQDSMGTAGAIGLIVYGIIDYLPTDPAHLNLYIYLAIGGFTTLILALIIWDKMKEWWDQ